ncbi:MAG: glycosyltransferase family 4 protein [Gemmatimonadetes bacterium]|nr:glycosyltransferase family 4 protein [Gemmatimonadota bacterium]
MAKILFLAADLSRNVCYTATQLAGALSGRHHVTVAGPASGDRWAPMREELSAAHALPGMDPRDPGVVRAARSLAEAHDLVYAVKAFPSSLGIALRCAAGEDVPLALHLDDWDAGFFAGRAPIRRLAYALRSLGDSRGEVALRRIERRVGDADALTVSSRRLQERFGGTLVRQGVDTSWFDPARYPGPAARERIGVPADAFVALFVGTPAAHKGGDVLSRIGPVLAPTGRVVVVSPAGFVAEASGVDLRPVVPFRESGWTLAAADVFVLHREDTPFAAHQTPAKLLLAMAMGLPVVATDVGDAREILGGEPAAGLVVPPGDFAAFRDAVLSLREDPLLRARLAEESRRRAVERFGWSAMAARLDAVLDPLLGSAEGVDGRPAPGR